MRSQRRSSTLRIVERDNHSLTPDMVADMEALARLNDPSLPPSHIQRNHVEGPEVTFYLVYCGDQLLSMQSYATHFTATPFHDAAIPVFEGRLTYKDPRHKLRGITARISYRHVRRTLGWAWMLRTWAAIGHSPNPRVYIQFHRIFGDNVYPRMDEEAPESVTAFLTALTGQTLTPRLVDGGQSHLADHADITDSYASLYATGDPKIDALFFRLGIFKRKAGRILLTDRSLYILSIYRPSDALRKALMNWLGGIAPATARER